jgi:hypothetical protein
MKMDDNRKSRNDSETNLVMPNNGPTSPIKSRSGSVSDVPRYEETLSFVAGDTGTQNMSAVDSDVYSWLLMNSDLFPSSNRNKNKDGNVDVNTSNVEVNDDTIVDDDILNVLKEESSEQKQKYNLNDSSIPLENGKPLSSLSAEEKRQRRLEKNREIARNCRKRKRERLGKMEDELKQLREENERLKIQVSTSTTKHGGMSSQRQKSIAKIRTLIGKNNEKDLVTELKEYRETFSDYGNRRKRLILEHLEDLKKLLLPTEMTKMCMWSLQQDDEFYDEEKNHAVFGGSIWTVLCETMQFTGEQKKKLIGMRHSIRSQRKNLSRSIQTLNELKDAVSNNMIALENNMTTILNSITPEQQAKFLLWVENNQTCMLMLNNLWDKMETQNNGVPSPMPKKKIVSSNANVSGSSSSISTTNVNISSSSSNNIRSGSTTGIVTE